MTGAPAQPERGVARGASAAHMYGALVGVGLACGMLIAGAHEATAPVIADNRVEALERAVFEVLPGARSSAAFVVADGRFVPAGGKRAEGPRVHAAYDEQGALMGMAVEASAMGYQDVISVLYGYALAEEAIVGLVVLESRETPGLGDEIENDPDFRANFEHLDVRLNDSGQALQRPIEVVDPGQKTAPHQIDTITGATISSSTVGKMVKESAAHWVPRLAARRDDFEREDG